MLALCNRTTRKRNAACVPRDNIHSRLMGQSKFAHGQLLHRNLYSVYSVLCTPCGALRIWRCKSGKFDVVIRGQVFLSCQFSLGG